jgi:thiol-disulfide isomerase/thioredoxin
MKTNLFLMLLSTIPALSFTQPTHQQYSARLTRPDGVHIPFRFEQVREQNKLRWYVLNASERLLVDDISQEGDSLLVQMPFFESAFKIALLQDGSMRGFWLKKTAAEPFSMPFEAKPVPTQQVVPGKAPSVVQGRWRVSFQRSNGTWRPSVGIFEQEGNRLTGTCLTPSGDYRFLEGLAENGQIQLSCFDGSHAYLFTGVLQNDTTITDGIFYAGQAGKENWKAIKDSKASLPDAPLVFAMKPGETKLNFRFPSIDGDSVSLSDARFRNKPVIIQIMGSWCPNCMDETAMLSNFYKQYHNKGVEVLALAYEYSTDFERSRKSIDRFRKRFDVQYPMLVTGVTVTDEKRAEKTLPQLTGIHYFPSTIFVGKDGTVRYLHQGYAGPATGREHEAFMTDFYRKVQSLLAE